MIEFSCLPSLLFFQDGDYTLKLNAKILHADKWIAVSLIPYYKAMNFLIDSGNAGCVVCCFSAMILIFCYFSSGHCHCDC